MKPPVVALVLSLVCAAARAGEAAAQPHSPPSGEWGFYLRHGGISAPAAGLTGPAILLEPGPRFTPDGDQAVVLPVRSPGVSLQQQVRMRDHVVPWAIEGAITGGTTGAAMGILGSVTGQGQRWLILGPAVGAVLGAGMGAAWGVVEHRLGLPIWAPHL